MINPIQLNRVPTIKYQVDSVNSVFDGNSLVFGVGTSGASGVITSQLAAMPPISSKFAIANTGVAGQTIANMRTRGSSFVDSKFVNGSKNVLIVWEGTNSICNSPGMNGLAAAAQMTSYIADRLAAKPDWLVLLVTCLPRFSSGGTYPYSIPVQNQYLNDYNAYLLNNWKAMGAKGIVDIRSSGIFETSTYTGTVPANMAPYFSDLIHLNDAGYGLVAQMIASTLRRLPKR